MKRAAADNSKTRSRSSQHWGRLIGTRIRLRDLHIMMAVACNGSMARAAADLGMSQPAISAAISDLERSVGYRLLDRGPRGVTPTPYGEALLKRSRAAFDELLGGLHEIHAMEHSTSGEVRIACSESMAAGVVVPILHRLRESRPDVTVHIEWASTDARQFQKLYERDVDLILGRLSDAAPLPPQAEPLLIDKLFADRFCIATGKGSQWAKRETIDIAELANADWITPPLDTVGASALMALFTEHGIAAPRVNVTTFSLHLRKALIEGGRYMTALPESVVRFNPQFSDLVVLPIELKMDAWSVGMVRLKERTTLPATQAFVACAKSVVEERFVAFPRNKLASL